MFQTQERRKTINSRLRQTVELHEKRIEDLELKISLLELRVAGLENLYLPVRSFVAGIVKDVLMKHDSDNGNKA